MKTPEAPPRFASAADPKRYGQYTIARRDDDPRPLYRFTGRLSADGSSGHRADAGRYHLYAGWFCPWSQRAAIVRALHGLEDVVSISYVDNARDARGWAFREAYGPDPINGFTLLREAYEATEPGFDGHVSVPTLWDRETGRIVSNDFSGIDVDLATAFSALSSGPSTLPDDARRDVEELDAWLAPTVNHGASTAVGAGAGAHRAREVLAETFEELDRRLVTRRYLLGSEITLADVRLFVSLVRYDPDAPSADGPCPRIADYQELWGYARDLYERPAFSSTTRFEAFARADLDRSAWSVAHGRDRPARIG